jgi:hypothetical protein
MPGALQYLFRASARAAAMGDSMGLVPKRPTAREQESAAASRREPRARRIAPVHPVHAFLLRRGLEVKPTEPDLPLPRDLDPARVDRFGQLLESYAFRLFVRGALKEPEGFLPEKATRYLSADQASALAGELLGLGVLERAPRGRFRFLAPARSFGGVLEWYVARELERRLGFSVATGLAWRARGVGGDLDVVAVADGRLVYLELKSAPPKHLSESEVASFCDRLHALRPDVALFVLDTSLRLSDKVLPMLGVELARRGPAPQPRRLIRELWAVTPHLFAANAKWDLMGNVIRGIAQGLRALSPEPPGPGL